MKTKKEESKADYLKDKKKLVETKKAKIKDETVGGTIGGTIGATSADKKKAGNIGGTIGGTIGATKKK